MSLSDGLYEKVLAAAGGALAAPKAPRPSAAVVLLRRLADGEIEIFWLQRGEILPFMGGWHAFPGGGLERGDASLPVAGTPTDLAPSGWTAASPESASSPTEPDLVPGLAACVLRELFEETGVLIANSNGKAPPRSEPRVPLPELAREFSAATTEKPESLAELRRSQLAGEKTLGPWLEKNGLALDASRLRFAGRWLTPPFSPARFDNRFFLLEWRPEDGQPRVLKPESEEGEWIAPRAALACLDDGSAIAAPPILHILRVLSEREPESAMARLHDTTEAHLGPLPRIEVRPGIVLLPLAAATLPPAAHTNAYLLGTGDCVLVDPGSPFETENGRLLAALEVAERRLGRKVRAIWLTHHHPDHVDG
ncbi:MAG: MBL fold metallo-hydrolase, partial [Thermoanaerobaculia bacterium]